MKEERQKVLHYKYTCKLTGKSSLAPYRSTGFPGNITEQIVKKRLELQELYKKATLEEMIDSYGELVRIGISP